MMMEYYIWHKLSETGRADSVCASLNEHAAKTAAYALWIAQGETGRVWVEDEDSKIVFDSKMQN